MKTLLSKIFATDGVIKGFKPDYIPRAEQVGAANVVFDVFKNKDRYILEGPTGFGKTYAYCIPAFLHIYNEILNCKDNNFKPQSILIVTNGITLQEQLVKKDLPNIEKFFKSLFQDHEQLASFSVKYALLKGRQNYICINKVKDFKLHPKNVTEAQYEEIIEKYESGLLDLSNLSFIPSYDLASQISCVNNSECRNRTCYNFENCLYQLSKLDAIQSNIIVTNYHMLFSDLETGNKILPAYNCIIFDEAQNLAEIYRDFKEEALSYSKLYNLFSDFKKLQDNIMANAFRTLFDKVLDCFSNFFDERDFALYYFSDLYNSFLKNNNKDFIILDEYLSLPENDNMFLCFNFLSSALGDLIQELEDSSEDDMFKCDPDFQIYRFSTEKIYEDINKMSSLLRDCYDEECYNPIENVYFIERTKNEFNKKTPHLIASLKRKPISVKETLCHNFYKDNLACIFTSATLSVERNFKFFRDDVGLNLLKDNVLVSLGQTPYDLSNQELWFNHPNVENAGFQNKANWLKTLPDNICDIILACGGGALCLFSSKESMIHCYESLRFTLKAKRINVLLQGDQPKIKLLEEFQKDKNSVLFGSKSYFEGVDIPGEALRCVVIDKLPFPNISDPIMTKLSNYYKARRQQYIFFERYLTPQMIITLKQQSGRGVRSVTDKVVISIMDDRGLPGGQYFDVIDKSYSYNRVFSDNLEDIEHFFRN